MYDNDYGNRFFMDNVNINGQNILAIEEKENKTFHTSIFPNPTQGLFTIRTDANKIKVEIYSSLGKLVTSENIISGLQQIDLSKQKKGIYFVKLIHNRKIEQRKLIIQ